MTPEQQAAVARVRDRFAALARFRAFKPDRPQEKKKRVDHRAERAMFFRSVKGGIDAAPWLRRQLEADCLDLMREAESDRLAFEAARIVSCTLRKERIEPPKCIQDFEQKIISGQIAPPNKNGNYPQDQRVIDAQILQCIGELCSVGFTKTVGKRNSAFFVVSDLLKEQAIEMGEQAVRAAYRRAKKSRELSKSAWQLVVAAQGKS